MKGIRTHTIDVRRATGLLLLVLLLVCILVLPALAQGGEPYHVQWYAIAGGGGQSSGDGYTLRGTVGQHDAGGLRGGGYKLGGGFWGLAAGEFGIYLPVIQR